MIPTGGYVYIVEVFMIDFHDLMCMIYSRTTEDLDHRLPRLQTGVTVGCRCTAVA